MTHPRHEPGSAPHRMNVHNDHGFVAAELVVMFGFVILPAMVALALLPQWWERQSLARVAAQEAARRVVLADSWNAGAAEAHSIVAQIAANHDVPSRQVGLRLQGDLRRGGQVTAVVTVDVPGIHVPLITTVGAFRLQQRHTEHVDMYRSFGSAGR